MEDQGRKWMEEMEKHRRAWREMEGNGKKGMEGNVRYWREMNGNEEKSKDTERD